MTKRVGDGKPLKPTGTVCGCTEAPAQSGRFQKRTIAGGFVGPGGVDGQLYRPLGMDVRMRCRHPL
jgi:hypothetical protein